MTKGRYGIHGGQYIPETLMNAVIELEEAYNHYKNDKEFNDELNTLLNEYAGRPSRLYYAKRMTEDLGGAVAVSSSSPSTLIVTSSPVLTPSPITPKILFASALFSPFTIVTADLYPAACFTRIPAGLAWIPSGSVTTYLNSFIVISSFY